MILRGEGLKVGHNIDTDVIIPARYLNVSTPEHLAKYCFFDLDLNIQEGTILLAGKNFGCGSSREHAPLSMKYAGISCVIAPSYARIFYRNAINIGLPILTCKEAVEESSEGDELVIDTEEGTIKNIEIDKSYKTQPLPSFIHGIIKAGGLMEFITRRSKTHA